MSDSSHCCPMCCSPCCYGDNGGSKDKYSHVKYQGPSDAIGEYYFITKLRNHWGEEERGREGNGEVVLKVLLEYLPYLYIHSI